MERHGSIRSVYSDDLVTMLKAHHPAALVLLAYWCALWFELEEHYVLLRGHSAWLLQIIENGLDPAYAPFIPRLGRNWGSGGQQPAALAGL